MAMNLTGVVRRHEGDDVKQFLKAVLRSVLGPDMKPLPEGKVGICYQARCVKKTWEAPSVGIARLLRLGLAASAFAFPTVYITHLLRKRSTNWLYMSIDVYVGLRLLVLLILLYSGSARGVFATGVIIYCLLDMLLYVAGTALLADIYEPPLSSVRSVVLALANYAESMVGFAGLYRLWGGLSLNPLCPVQALYFSVVTATTVGFGDIHPLPGATTTQVIVIAQIFTTFVFVSVLLAALVARVGTRSQ